MPMDIIRLDYTDTKGKYQQAHLTVQSADTYDALIEALKYKLGELMLDAPTKQAETIQQLVATLGDIETKIQNMSW